MYFAVGEDEAASLVKAFANSKNFTATLEESANNNKYNPVGQNMELEVNNTVGVTITISEKSLRNHAGHRNDGMHQYPAPGRL